MDSVTSPFRPLRTRPYYSRRCKRVRPVTTITSIESLPNELLSDILLRLPADYLHDRARFVCHRWYCLIHSYHFVHTQIHHSTYGLLICRERSYPLFMTATPTQLGQIEMSEFSRICTTRISSCNGLALDLNFRTKLLHVINLATGQTRVLPSSSTCVRDIPHRCGIAYAAASMRYKVTVPYRRAYIHLAILTVGVDNSWREVEVEHLSKHARLLVALRPLISDGFMHFVSWHTRSIVTFDVETEILSESEVPLPHPFLGRSPKNEKHWYYLSTGRFLSLLVGNLDFSWEVWGMESRSGEWSKLLPDIDLGAHKCRLLQFAYGQSKVLNPTGWVKYPEILALGFNDSQACIFYNLVTREISSTNLPGTKVLGKGSHGTTYKAILDEAMMVVVKRLKDVGVGKKEFDQFMEMVCQVHEAR
ncbi:hypothetical protein OROMI_027649 [Orobanche minor]